MKRLKPRECFSKCFLTLAIFMTGLSQYLYSVRIENHRYSYYLHEYCICISLRNGKLETVLARLKPRKIQNIYT